MTFDVQASTRARIAGQDEGVGLDELALAARNHGLPLEALRYDLTPTGLHYLLVHYDIPAVDPATWELLIDGAVSTPLRLDLDALRQRPRVTLPVTLECAGNGRARLSPRPVSQPWLVEAVGTAEWTGTPLAPLLAEAGLSPEWWTWCSPAPTVGWNAASCRTTSGRCRPWTPAGTRCCWRTR